MIHGAQQQVGVGGCPLLSAGQGRCAPVAGEVDGDDFEPAGQQAQHEEVDAAVGGVTVGYDKREAGTADPYLNPALAVVAAGAGRYVHDDRFQPYRRTITIPQRPVGPVSYTHLTLPTKRIV